MKTFNREARLDREENRALARERSRRSRVACPHCGAHVGGKAPAPCLHCERASRKGDNEPVWYDAAMIATDILMDAKTGMYTDSTFADIFCFAVEEFMAGMGPLEASQEGIRLAQVEFDRLCKECAARYPANEEVEIDPEPQVDLSEEDCLAWKNMRAEIESVLTFYRGDFLRLLAVAVRAGSDVEPIRGLRQNEGETFLEFMDRCREARTNGIFRAAVKAAMEATDRDLKP